MAAGFIFIPAYNPAFDRNGDLISGALMYVYANNSSTLVPIYEDFALTVPASNPQIANASGQFLDVYAEAGTDELPVLYRVSFSKPDGSSPGNPYVFNDYRPNTDPENVNVTNKLNKDGDNAAPEFLDNVGAAALDGSNFAAPSGSDPSGALAFRESIFQYGIPPELYGAEGNGTTNDRAAFALADAADGGLTLGQNYRISSNITLSSQVTFEGDARLTIDAGVTVTFSDSIVAPDRQIFYGDGEVRGLSESRAMWFAGDSAENIAIDSQPRLQKWADSLVYKGVGLLSSGVTWYITGATPITFSNSQQVISEGKTRIAYTSRTSNVIKVMSAAETKFSGIEVFRTNPLWSTAGVVLDIVGVLASFPILEDVAIKNGYIGVRIDGAVAGSMTNCRVEECMYIGIECSNLNDFIVSNSIISCPIDFFTITPGTGTFQPGEVLNVSGNRVGVFYDYQDSTNIRGHIDNVNPAPGDVLTGATSGATATIVSQSIPFLLGGIRLENFVEGFMCTNVEVIGGVHSLTTTASTFQRTLCPAFNFFVNTYFDSSDFGVVLDKIISTRFTNCWISNRPNNGVTLYQTDGIEFIGCIINASHQHGLVVTSQASRWSVRGGEARGNGILAPATYDGIHVEANGNGFNIDGVNTDPGVLASTFGLQRSGVYVAAGTTNNYFIAASGSVIDLGTGANKRVTYRTNGPKRQVLSPSINSATGIINDASGQILYSSLDGFTDFTVNALVVDAGSGSGELWVNLPQNAVELTTFSGTNLQNGRQVQAVVLDNQSLLRIKNADGSSLIANGANPIITGRYRTVVV